jgi:3D (Asp-Asp-Asp) domain-containing protein
MSSIRTHLFRTAIAVLALAAASCAPQPAPQPMPVPQAPQPAPELMAFEATAYSIEGKTASGDRAREGVVAADPKHLPLDTRIRVHDAGPYSGEYVVADTGRTIKGREIDIYIADDREAKKFGRKNVKVEILQRAKYAER